MKKEFLVKYEVNVSEDNYEEKQNIFFYTVLYDSENCQIKGTDDTHKGWTMGKINLYNNEIIFTVNELL